MKEIKADYYYIVVTILEKKYFVTPKVDFVQQFDNILKFHEFETAEAFCKMNRLYDLDAVILGINEARRYI